MEPLADAFTPEPRTMLSDVEPTSKVKLPPVNVRPVLPEAALISRALMGLFARLGEPPLLRVMAPAPVPVACLPVPTVKVEVVVDVLPICSVPPLLMLTAVAPRELASASVPALME